MVKRNTRSRLSGDLLTTAQPSRRRPAIASVMTIPALLLLVAVASSCGYHRHDARIERPVYAYGYDTLPGSDVPSVEVFYDELEPWGAWLHDDRFGFVFAPSDRDYTPYTDGRWAATEFGPTWISDHPIDWAVSHYGRWVHDGEWLWIPDTRWGPAWVEWRRADTWLGWAPLGLSSHTTDIPYDAWRFVPVRRIYDRRLHRHYVAPQQIESLVSASSTAHRWVHARDGRRYVRGPERINAGTWHGRRYQLSELPLKKSGRYRVRSGRRQWAPRRYRVGRDKGTRFQRAPIVQHRRAKRAKKRKRRYIRVPPPSAPSKATKKRRSRRSHDRR